MRDAPGNTAKEARMGSLCRPGRAMQTCGTRIFILLERKARACTKQRGGTKRREPPKAKGDRRLRRSGKGRCGRMISHVGGERRRDEKTASEAGGVRRRGGRYVPFFEGDRRRSLREQRARWTRRAGVAESAVGKQVLSRLLSADAGEHVRPSGLSRDLRQRSDVVLTEVFRQGYVTGAGYLSYPAERLSGAGMTRFEFHDAAGNVHPFETLSEAEAFARACGYVFVTSRSVMEGSDARISYFLAPSDVPAGVEGEAALLPLLLAKYLEWKEPRIMPVMEAEAFKE